MLKKNLTRETLTNKLYQNLGFSKNISKETVETIVNQRESFFKQKLELMNIVGNAYG